MYCECGCGGITNIITMNKTNPPLKKGEHRRFIKGHQRIGKTNKNNHNRKGCVIKRKDYYVTLLKEHPNADVNGYVPTHRLICEKVLGRILYRVHPVHHMDGITTNNDNNNLVICENNAYHRILHRRKRALENCGNANFIKCRYCKEYDDPTNMYIPPNESSGRHRSCWAKYTRELRWLKEGKL